jgi:hypothetical protein
MRAMTGLRRAGRILGLFGFLAVLAAPQTALAGPPWATDEPSFQSSYLQAGDLPGASDKSGDWAAAGCDGAAAANGCSFSGKKLWTAKDQAAPVWQVHDIRWVFPDAAAAQRYLQQGTKELSEGLPPVSQPPMVGSDTQMYTAQGDAYGLGIQVFMYDLVFRVDNVVVKIFVSQGPSAAQKVLTPLMVAALGQKAVDRIRAAEPSRAPVAVAPVPVPVQPPAPPPEPVPEPMAIVEPQPQPQPEPPPEPRPQRERGRLAREVRDYWRGGVDKPYVYIGGNYSRAFGSYKLPGGTPIKDINGFDISVGALVHPRAYFQVMFHREVWQVPDIEELLVRRLEFVYGLDLLALPPSWRIRPALMALLGFGLGFGRVDSLQGSSDPLVPVPVLPVTERRAIGVGGLFGGDFAVHIRITEKFEIAPYGGVMIPAYTYTNDFPAADRRIDGERGFGRAWRWHVGLRIGFGGRS